MDNVQKPSKTRSWVVSFAARCHGVGDQLLLHKEIFEHNGTATTGFDQAKPQTRYSFSGSPDWSGLDFGILE